VVSRTRLWLILGVCGISVATPVSASAHGSHALCAGSPTVSALNQYCEDIPGARGGSTPVPGQPSVATSLAPRTVAKLSKSPAHSKRAELLGLPAAAQRVPIRVQQSSASIAAASASAPWLIIAILAATLLGVGLLAAALATQRRGRMAP
jgi:hypothetical protein